MRADLSAAFIAAKDAVARTPRQLAVFHFPVAGDVFVSDQALGAADGLANEYQPLVEDWGELLDMAGGDPQDHQAGEIRQWSITLWNGGDRPFSDYFLQEDPENITVNLYQWFVGCSDADRALIDTMVVQDPIEFDETSRLLRLDLVSLAMRYDNPVGDVLLADDWPNAMEADLGRGIPLAFGTPGEVQTLCAKTAPQATLKGSVLAKSGTINCNENLDKQGFPAAGIMQVGEELIRYASRTAASFTVAQRGYLSEASEHLDRDKIVQKIDDHTFLVSKGPIASINNVKVGGFAPPPEIYTPYPTQDPARIVFSEKPYSYRYAQGSTFLEMQFDTTNSDNTAVQAYLAYDPAAKTSAAKINPGSQKLSIRQTTANHDRGEIVKAYLAVEHWESDKFPNDFGEVEIAGLGVVGRLSRPNPEDVIDVAADVDIDHPHQHSISGEHFHTFVDPTIKTNDPKHGHGLSGSYSTVSVSPNGPVPDSFSIKGAPITGQNGYGSKIFEFNGVPATWTNARIKGKTTINYGHYIEVDKVQDTKYINTTFKKQLDAEVDKSGAAWEVGIGAGHTSTGKLYITLAAATHVTFGGRVDVLDLDIEFTVDNSLTEEKSGVSATITSSGQNLGNSDKSTDDVKALATDNHPLENVNTEASTRTVVNLFDITEAVNFDWDWFTNQDVAITYQGTDDAKTIHILHVFFDIEYRKRERVFSDEVTCEIEGLVDDPAGTYTGTPNALICRPDHARKYLLCHCGGMPISHIDTASFADLGSRYAALGYRFDGLLDAAATVREAEKKLAYQCRSRFFWSAGCAKIKLREKLTGLSVAKHLDADSIRLKSIGVQRQRLTDLANNIKLCYAKSWTNPATDSSAFAATAAAQDNDSIAHHGSMEKRDGFLFDMVADQTMAADLVEFYLENLAYPSSFYTFEAYLPQFDLEKEDCIGLTANFNKLRKARMVVRAIDRIFGSGKLKKVNSYRIVAEVLRYILLEHNLADNVGAFDELSIDITREGFLADLVSLTDDQVFALLVVSALETATVTDTLQVLFAVAESFAESIIASDTVAATMNGTLTDTANVFDIYQVYGTEGFGSGGFGSTGFGGLVIWRDSNPDEALVTDILAAVLNLIFNETATVSDDLVFSAGFGGLGLDSGFGVTPFGS